MKALAIIQLVNAALSAVNSAAAQAIIEDIRKLIATMFSAGVISIEEQRTTRDYVDQVEAMVKGGIVPKHWTVEPDPQ